MSDNAGGILLTGKTYDVTKKLTQVVLPATAALYFGLSSIWGLPNAEQVVGTIAVLTTFLGVILGLSSSAYNNSDARFDGTLEVSKDDNRLVNTIELTTDPAQLAKQKEMVLKVKKVTQVTNVLPADEEPRQGL